MALVRKTRLESRTPIKRKRDRPRRKGEPKPKEAIKTYRDGREVCNLETAAGLREYKGRVEAMRLRQGGVCCLLGFIEGCPGALHKDEATFEHEEPRGMGAASRDDRIEIDGRRVNGASHAQCNSRKGSRRIAFNAAE